VALNFYELAQSRPLERTIENASITLKWIAMYATNENVVYAALLALVAPTRWDGLRRSEVKLDPQGGGVWMCEVTYAWTPLTQDSPEQQQPEGPKPGDPLGPEWSFDGSAGQVHVTQSIQTKQRVGRGANVPMENNQAIGLRPDGVDGCDIFAPKFEFTLSLSFPFITMPQIRRWSKITGRTNNASFLTWSTGELLYLGPSVNIQPGQLAKVVHKFAGGRNLALPDDEADLTIVPETIGPNGQPQEGTGLILDGKNAHEYVWVAYQAGTPTPGMPWVPEVAHSAYVEQVYRSADFTPLLSGA
jgi:hypothetical protein